MTAPRQTKTDQDKLRGFMIVLRRALLMICSEIEKNYGGDSTNG